MTPLSINYSPARIHTLHPPPLHTLPGPCHHSQIRSAVSQTPPAPAPHRKEADQREKPTVSRNRKGSCAERHSPTQRRFSRLSPSCSLPPWPVPSHLSCFAHCRTWHTASISSCGLHCKTCKVQPQTGTHKGEE